jgi:hypothetical protein
MKFKFFSLLLFLSFTTFSFSQELFPLTEPASTIPKGVIGLRNINQTFNEFGTQKYLSAMRVMYGLTSHLSISGTISFSNHHNSYLPLDLITHTHQGNTTSYFTHNTKKGKAYPMNYAGLYFYAKYRIVSMDKKNEHFRIALYGEYSTVDQAHNEAEASLMDDSKGYGGGSIVTYLKNHFATSLITGFSIPGTYTEQVKYVNEPTITTTSITYAKSFNYSLSFGYLLFPTVYKNYSQLNINLYSELIGKTYSDATIYQNNVKLKSTSNSLISSNYIEIHPGVQAIIHSNLRIDFSIGYNLIKRSYTHQYPIYTLSIQRYFYR